ncbi:MAG: hypothetical protein HDT43_06965 [Ruminococcaceae bacterium]|nr:hypothetical protein [Oscillospiraceae bacterium]
MAVRKKTTVKEFFIKNNAKILKFGKRFVDLLNDEELICAYAEKDLEKLARTWRLVLEMLEEHTREDAVGQLAELIGEYNEIDKDGEE